ncbi:DUF4176 domain-containing protein [Clostridium sp. MB05]|uniref:DUF4176 domain-containing protein n=1 Tax=Clostridium sp. MB05 TaxID=3376682 RepID=UPI003981B2FE
MYKLLPIGSVVMIDPEKKEKIMIIGRLMRKEEGGEVYDYCGCLAPFGIQSQNQIKLFNHKDLTRLLFIGYQDEEELQFALAAAMQREKAQSTT